MSRIRHATETFVNHLIDGVKKLISSNTEQINVLSVKTLNVKSQDDWGNDFNNANTNGMYHIINCQSLKNKPPTIENVGNLIVMSGTENNSLSKVQYFIPFNNTGFYMRTRGYGLDEWMEWKEIATTTKTDISFPFTGSYMSRGGYVSKVTKDAMGLVTINVTFQINDGSTLLPQGNNIIGTLPVGYRPQGIVAGVGSTAFGGNMVNVRVTVGSDGVVTCTTGNGYTGSNVIGFSISYYV